MMLTAHAQDLPGLTIRSRGNYVLQYLMADEAGVLVRLESWKNPAAWLELALTRDAIAALLAMTDARPAPGAATPTPTIPCPPARVPEAG